jgi:hypothetical protein
VAAEVEFLVMVQRVVQVVEVPQSITRLFTRAALEIRHPLHHHKVTLVVVDKELMVLTKPEEEAVERLLLEQTV